MDRLDSWLGYAAGSGASGGGIGVNRYFFSLLLVTALLAAPVQAASPDEAIAQWIQGWDTPWLEEFSHLGEAPAYVSVALLLAAAGDLETVELIIEAEAGAAVVTWGGKVGVGRARPWSGHDASTFVGPTFDGRYHSFPSGHTASAFALATVLAERYPNWAPVWYGLATCVGLARISAGAHWPSDVLAGAVVGHLAGRAAVAGRPWFGIEWNF